MDAATVRKRLNARVWRSPLTWLPTVAGLATLAFAGGTGTLAIVGAAGIVVGVGSAIWKLTAGGEKLTDETLQQLRREAHRRHLTELRKLQALLRTDKDPRTGELIRGLRNLYKRMHTENLLADSDGPSWQYEIRQQLSEFYNASIDSLRRTHQFWQLANDVHSEKERDQLMQSREDLITELQDAVTQLGSTVDAVHLQTVKQALPDQNLSQVQQELQQGLEVARRVQQRLDQITASAGKLPDKDS